MRYFILILTILGLLKISSVNCFSLTLKELDTIISTLKLDGYKFISRISEKA
ncbi:MAG: hypothetical protein N2712_00690 [Brevinematales bacterium]|nr:hypothetical protein [Brevinematales bacterium]